MAKRKKRRGWVVPTVVIGTIVGGAVIGGNAIADRLSEVGTELFLRDRCTATSGELSSRLTAEQSNFAALIVSQAENRDLPARASTIAIATAIQESGLRNIDYGDRDSIGLFQQRPSQGWGTEAEILDPHYSTDTFLDALIRVDGWRDMEVTVAAQTVQRSAFPDAYADHEDQGRAWASALTGHAGTDAVTCELHRMVIHSDTPTPFVERIERDWEGTVSAVVENESDGNVQVRIDTDDERRRDGTASWVVAISKYYPIVEIHTCGMSWDRDSGEWTAVEQAETPCSETEVAVVLQTR